ncbi:HEAT repeat-containing protein 3-like [Diadema antillarum]|uniref:HEAT repeat-containing protein 3-like n=1 Tax=Diadema antillarum TaxID=105358 RepID=UPI003A854A26
MGKARNKKYRTKKSAPTGLQSVKDAQQEEELAAAVNTKADVQLKTVGLLERLQSSSAEERECACTSLANIVQDPKAHQTLVEQKAVRSLSPLLLDPSAGIREAAAGALRNFTVTGGHDICDHMVCEDVMTPLVSFLLQYSGGIPELAMKQKEGKAHKNDPPALGPLMQALHLVWNLCENNSTAVAIANQQGLLTVFLHSLQTHRIMVDLAITAAQCLHTFTEDNTLAAQELCRPERLLVLEDALLCSDVSWKHTQLQTLTAGILFNIRGSLPATSRGQSFQAVVKVLTTTLLPNASSAVTQLLPSMQPNGNALNCATVEEQKTEDDKYKTIPPKLDSNMALAEALLNAQQVALEIISNLCCPEDEDGDWEDMDSSSSSSSGSDDIQDESSKEVPDPVMSPLCLSAEIHSALINHSLPSKILEKIDFPDRSLLQRLVSLKEGKPLFKGLLQVQSRALLCLHNMVGAMELESLGGPEAMNLLLDRLLSISMHEPAPVGNELIEALTSALRAVFQKMAQIQCVPEALKEVHLSKLCSFAGGNASPHIRVNLVGILGGIGSILAKRKDTESLLTAVGHQLLEVATKDASLWVAAESLDAIFDTFADGLTADHVAVEIGLTARLKALVPQLKSKLRQNRGTLGEHLPIIMNARTNLGRFIKYKDNQERSLGASPPT